MEGRWSTTTLNGQNGRYHNDDMACRRSHTGHALVVLERRAVLNSRMELSEAIRSHGELHTGLVAIVATGLGGKLHIGPEIGYCDTIRRCESVDVRDS